MITGANRGIGYSFASYYTKKGYKVSATVRDVSKSTSLVELGCHVLSLDCFEESSLKTFADSIPKEEPIHLLINNAGIIDRNSCNQVTFKNMHDCFQVNTVAPLMVIQTLMSRLLLGNAKVINITSRVGSIDDNGSGG